MYLPEGQKTVADWTEVLTHRVNHLILSFTVSGDLHVTFFGLRSFTLRQLDF